MPASPDPFGDNSDNLMPDRPAPDDGGLGVAIIKKLAPMLLICAAATVVITALNRHPELSGNHEGQQPAGARLQAMVSSAAEAPASNPVTSELRIPANRLGHFLIDTEVNGEPVRFLVDTGATKVALAATDAERLGLHLEDLSYDEIYKTANGEIRAAPVTLRQIRVGQFVLYDVEAIVTDAPLHMSLLGMTFLGRLQSYKVHDNNMVMAW